MTIFVASLNFKTTESQLKDLFDDFGVVEKCKIVMDKDTGKSKGFAFVEMSDSDAKRAIKGINGLDFNGRTLLVKESQPK